MVRALSQAEIDAIAANGRELLRKERAQAAPKVVNLDAAIALNEPIPLLWDGVEYSVRPISYRAGLQLQKASMEIQRWAEHPPRTPAEVERQEAFVADLLALMHSLLDPRPRENPFADASPWEVGQLAAFFLMCQTRQRGRSRLGAAPPRFSM